MLDSDYSKHVKPLAFVITHMYIACMNSEHIAPKTQRSDINEVLQQNFRIPKL